MTDRPVFLYAAIYDDLDDAEADYEAVFELHAAGAIGTYDSAIITKDAERQGPRLEDREADPARRLDRGRGRCAGRDSCSHPH